MLEKIVARDENVAWRIMEKEAILLSAEDSSVHSLDEVGTRIWTLADGKLTVQQIIDELFNEYEVDYETLKKDVVDFIDSLMQNEKSLIRLVEPGEVGNSESAEQKEP